MKDTCQGLKRIYLLFLGRIFVSTPVEGKSSLSAALSKISHSPHFFSNLSFSLSLSLSLARLQITVHFKKMSCTLLGMSQSLSFFPSDRLLAREL